MVWRSCFGSQRERRWRELSIGWSLAGCGRELAFVNNNEILARFVHGRRECDLMKWRTWDKLWKERHLHLTYTLHAEHSRRNERWIIPLTGWSRDRGFGPSVSFTYDWTEHGEHNTTSCNLASINRRDVSSSHPILIFLPPERSASLTYKEIAGDDFRQLEIVASSQCFGRILSL